MPRAKTARRNLSKGCIVLYFNKMVPIIAMLPAAQQEINKDDKGLHHAQGKPLKSSCRFLVSYKSIHIGGPSALSRMAFLFFTFASLPAFPPPGRVEANRNMLMALF
jgi:hypothetical protein